MKAREVVARLRQLGCEERKGKGSHVVFKSGSCRTTVSVHKGKEIKAGTLRGIERDMEPALGKGWLTGTDSERGGSDEMEEEEGG
jgi:predicted RNA binding protein YcfA (HicA-like mRNA interferase family)